MSERFSIRYGFDPSWLDQIFDLYNKTDLKRNNKEQVKQAFINSQVVASVWNDGNPIAIGRAISDFKMYSSIYDVVVAPEFQKRGLGKLVMTGLLERSQGTCVYLTSTFGNENFYKGLGFRFHKTALALYPEKMQNSSYLHATFKIPDEISTFKDSQIRVGQFEDIQGCFLLNEQLGYKTDEHGFAKRFCSLIGSPEHSIIVAKNQETIVAWMHLGIRHLLEDEDFAELAAIVVKEEHRSSGIGAHMLKVAEYWALQLGFKQIRLHSSLSREQAHQFYLKNGYTNKKTSKLFVKELG
jgi:GNAT superfamily N-acetyltransferase